MTKIEHLDGKLFSLLFKTEHLLDQLLNIGLILNTTEFVDDSLCQSIEDLFEYIILSRESLIN